MYIFWAPLLSAPISQTHEKERQATPVSKFPSRSLPEPPYDCSIRNGDVSDEREREVRRSPLPTSLPPQPPLLLLLLLLRLPSCSGSSRSFGSSERQIVTGHSRCRDKGRRMGIERRERRRRRLGTDRGAKKKKKKANEDRR